jgi:hypothetical protein
MTSDEFHLVFFLVKIRYDRIVWYIGIRILEEDSCLHLWVAYTRITTLFQLQGLYRIQREDGDD